MAKEQSVQCCNLTRNCPQHAWSALRGTVCGFAELAWVIAQQARNGLWRCYLSLVPVRDLCVYSMTRCLIMLQPSTCPTRMPSLPSWTSPSNPRAKINLPLLEVASLRRFVKRRRVASSQSDVHPRGTHLKTCTSPPARNNNGRIQSWDIGTVSAASGSFQQKYSFPLLKCSVLWLLI